LGARDLSNGQPLTFALGSNWGGGVVPDMPTGQHEDQTGWGMEEKDLSDERARHDLRQSLTAVMALAAIVDRQPLDGENIRDSLDKMAHEVDWMSQVLTQHRGSDAASLVDVADTTDEVWQVVATCTSCRMRLVREADLLVNADPVTLARSVRNLLDNAVRAAGPDGAVEVTVEGRGDDVVVTVADDGPGFGLVTPQQGLGLLTVRRFAAEHGGRFVVGRSSTGGALVELVLPRVADHDEADLAPVRTTA
jgi:signal transduction histidine kinase